MTDEIEQYIPQRPPFLFVDRIVEQESNRIICQKDVKADELYFQGHFPGRPVMPGVLICEFVFQTAGILMAKLEGNFGNALPILTRIQNVRIKNAVFPGNTIQAEVSLNEKISNAYYMQARVTEGSKKIMSLEFTGMLTEEVT